MIEDIRLSTDFLTHRKRKKLQRKLGPAGVLSLIDLWLTTAVQRPLGVLEGYSNDDIEIDANWDGEPGVFVQALVEIGFLDEIDGVYSLHGWDKRQAWVIESKDRGDKARLSRLAKINPCVYNELKEMGVTSISKKEYQKLKRKENDETTNVNDKSTNVKASLTPVPVPVPTKESIADSDESATEEAYKTKSGKSLSGKRLESFNLFWEAFSLKNGKAAAADAWLKIPRLTDAMVDEICRAARCEATRRPEIEKRGLTPKWAQGWLTERRWEDEINKPGGHNDTAYQALIGNSKPRTGEECDAEIQRILNS